MAVIRAAEFLDRSVTHKGQPLLRARTMEMVNGDGKIAKCYPYLDYNVTHKGQPLLRMRSADGSPADAPPKVRTYGAYVDEFGVRRWRTGMARGCYFRTGSAPVLCLPRYLELEFPCDLVTDHGTFRWADRVLGGETQTNPRTICAEGFRTSGSGQSLAVVYVIRGEFQGVYPTFMTTWLWVGVTADRAIFRFWWQTSSISTVGIVPATFGAVRYRILGGPSNLGCGTYLRLLFTIEGEAPMSGSFVKFEQAEFRAPLPSCSAYDFYCTQEAFSVPIRIRECAGPSQLFPQTPTLRRAFAWISPSSTCRPENALWDAGSC